MNPWKALLSVMTVIGGAFFSATAFASTLTLLPESYNSSTKVATIGVVVYGDTERVGAGSLVFTESGSTLGTFDRLPNCDVPQINSCVVRLALAPGYALGPHTITASYSGVIRLGTVLEGPASLTFTIYVSDVSWLPGVLSLLD